MSPFHFSENNFFLSNTQGHIQITAYLPGCIRIRYSTKPEFEPHQSFMVQFEPRQFPSLSVTESPQWYIVSTSDLSIQVDKQTLAFMFTDSSGKLLLKEPDRGGKKLESVDAVINILDTDTEIQMEHTPDGEKIRAQSPIRTVKKAAYQAKLEFKWAEGEALYGLGSHEEGMFNLRGQCQYLYQQNMKVFIPVLISTRGYGLVFDQYSPMTFHDDAIGSYLLMELVDELDYYFIYGPEFDQIVATIRTLTRLMVGIAGSTGKGSAPARAAGSAAGASGAGAGVLEGITGGVEAAVSSEGWPSRRFRTGRPSVARAVA